LAQKQNFKWREIKGMQWVFLASKKHSKTQKILNQKSFRATSETGLCQLNG
jgi:hypothetical protein